MAKHWGLPQWPAPKFEVGDIVTLRWGGNEKEGLVLEDRGAYGNPPEHVYRLEIAFDEWNTERLEFPEEKLQLKKAKKTAVR